MLAIRDVMRLVPCHVSTLALGLACSAGQFLLSAGTRGRRFALPHARILMHRGSAGIDGSAVDIEVQADDLRHTVDTVLGLIAEDTGQPPTSAYGRRLAPGLSFRYRQTLGRG
jgi:ATP-dependent Clp protease, protease subunit